MHHEILIDVSGPPGAPAAFADTELAGHLFSFERVRPTPPPLHVDTSSFAEDGHHAVAGDWQVVARREMLREPAARLGRVFPLVSRADVLACFTELGPIGAEQLALGRRIESNLQTHGHRDAASWRKAHWGIECDAEDVVADPAAASVRLAFRLLGAPPKKLLAVLSARHADLRFRTIHASPGGKRAAESVLHRGKEVSKAVADGPATLALIRAFREAHGLAWLARLVGAEVVDGALHFDETGKAVFTGTTMALAFALARLRAGETAQELAARFPELNDRHRRAMEQLVRAGYNAR